MIEFDKLELSRMTWREIFDVIQGNFEKVYNMILANSVEVYIEQFEGGKSVYNLQHEVNEDTTLLVYRGNQFLGGKEGTSEYSVGRHTLTFTSPVEQDDMVTVQFMQANALANISQEYVNQIKALYDNLGELSKDTKEMYYEVKSMKDMLFQWGIEMLEDFKELKAQVQNTQTRVEATKDYIEEIMGGQELPEGSVEGEVYAARRQYFLLGERLDNMPFKVQSVEEMQHTTQLREGDVVLVGDDDFVITYKIMAEYTGPIQNFKLDNNLIAVRANSSIQVGSYEEGEYDNQEEKSIYVLTGEKEKPIVLSELNYGVYYIDGFYKIYSPDDTRYLDEPIYVQVVWSNVGGDKIRTITVGVKLYIVRMRGLNSYLTVIPEVGETNIETIGDGTITGAIKSIADDIAAMKKVIVKI